VGALPILNYFIDRMGLAAELTLALKNAGYADALLALIKNIVVERDALYAVGEWAALYDVGLVAQGKIGDDKLGRALDRLFAADRATLQTRIVLAAIKGFELKMLEIHNDTTSVMVRGAYDGQNPKAVQLKRGHSKERRPDLKQSVYSLCITADGADLRFCVKMGLRHSGHAASTHNDEQDVVAREIVEHFGLSKLKIEPGEPLPGHGQGVIPPGKLIK
jgi:hypothetical protein